MILPKKEKVQLFPRPLPQKRGEYFSGPISSPLLDPFPLIQQDFVISHAKKVDVSLPFDSGLSYVTCFDQYDVNGLMT